MLHLTQMQISKISPFLISNKSKRRRLLVNRFLVRHHHIISQLSKSYLLNISIKSFFSSFFVFSLFLSFSYQLFSYLYLTLTLTFFHLSSYKQFKKITIEIFKTTKYKTFQKLLTRFEYNSAWWKLTFIFISDKISMKKTNFLETDVEKRDWNLTFVQIHL